MQVKVLIWGLVRVRVWGMGHGAWGMGDKEDKGDKNNSPVIS